MRRTADDLPLLMEATGEDKTPSLRFTGDFFGVDGLLFECLLFDGDESDDVSLTILLSSSLGGSGRRDNDFVMEDAFFFFVFFNLRRASVGLLMPVAALFEAILFLVLRSLMEAAATLAAEAARASAAADPFTVRGDAVAAETLATLRPMLDRDAFFVDGVVDPRVGFFFFVTMIEFME